MKKHSKYLDKYLVKNKKRGLERVHAFISNKAPIFRPILLKISENKLCVDPCSDDKKIELMLQEYLYNIEVEHLHVVVEIKRPMHNDNNDEDIDPIKHTLGYLEKIRQGQIIVNGGQIVKSESIPIFCYIICDITPKIQEICKMHDLTLTNDGLSYFFYHKNLKAFVEVISFSRLVKSTKERNRAFFDKLGLPTS